jgi:hypothetical protein
MQPRILSKAIDERFLDRRRRSSSVAGMASAALALLLFEYRHFADHEWDWNLLSVGVAFVAIKLSMMLWYRFTG